MYDAGFLEHLADGGEALFEVEALGVHLFERIEGDHFTILGLPLLPLLAYLRAEGSLS